jgi:hypothetical protein
LDGQKRNSRSPSLCRPSRSTARRDRRDDKWRVVTFIRGRQVGWKEEKQRVPLRSAGPPVPRHAGTGGMTSGGWRLLLGAVRLDGQKRNSGSPFDFAPKAVRRIAAFSPTELSSRLPRHAVEPERSVAGPERCRISYLSCIGSLGNLLFSAHFFRGCELFPELCCSFLLSSTSFGPGGIDVCDLAKALKSRLIANSAIHHLAGTNLNAEFSARVLRFIQREPPQNGDRFFFGQSGRFHLQRHPCCWTKSGGKKLRVLYRKSLWPSQRREVYGAGLQAA